MIASMLNPTVSIHVPVIDFRPNVIAILMKTWFHRRSILQVNCWRLEDLKKFEIAGPYRVTFLSKFFIHCGKYVVNIESKYEYNAIIGHEW